MVVDTPGWVTDDILLLGRTESCVYLLRGADEYVMLGGGCSYIVPDMLEQLNRFGIEEQKIRRMVILHSHFDHCGVIPFFKTRWPWATVVASERARSLLSSPQVVKSIASLNDMLTENYGLTRRLHSLKADFSGITVEETVREDDTIPCGPRQLRVLDVPGHSSCAIALYEPQLKALFASDAAGIPFGDQVFTAANSNYDAYMKSLKKMAGLEIDIHLAEHYGARTGEDGRLFLNKALQSAVETRTLLEKSYRETQNVEESTKQIVQIIMASRPRDFFPQAVIELVVGQMMKYVAGVMDTSDQRDSN
ncbi:MAG: MBL fold metallo-hydrolase [Desulfatirhabdiaceae bacterium]